MKVAICVPHYGDVKAKFFESVANTITRTLTTRINYNGAIIQPVIRTFTLGSASIDANRNALVTRAQKWGADYILFVDSDMTFPPDALLQLLAASKPVVGCNYAFRDASGPMAGSAAGGEWSRVSGGRGVQPITFLGLGLCLINAQVFNELPKPWFRTTIGDDGQVIEGEDGHFFALLRKRGIQAFVHHDLSEQVEHLAERGVRLADIAGRSDASSVLSASGP